MNEAPARASLRPIASPASFAGLGVESFEVISRGDLVSGLRIRKPGGRPAHASDARPGLVFLVHDAADAACSDRWQPLARLIARGVEAVAIDLPLHGPRASAKLSERLVASVASLARGAAISVESQVLVDEFARQANHDLERTLSAFLARGEHDVERVAVVGLGLGAWVAGAWIERDRRVGVAVLVRTGHTPATHASMDSPPNATARSTAGAAATDAAGRPARLTLEESGESLAWALETESFLASRLGV